MTQPPHWTRLITLTLDGDRDAAHTLLTEARRRQETHAHALALAALGPSTTDPRHPSASHPSAWMQLCARLEDLAPNDHPALTSLIDTHWPAAHRPLLQSWRDDPTPARTRWGHMIRTAMLERPHLDWLDHLPRLDALALEDPALIRLPDIPSTLHTLSLNRSSIGVLDGLRRCTALHTLQLDSVNHLQDLTPLRHLTSLRHLTLNACTLTDFSPLQHLTSLHTLKLYSTYIRDLTPLQHLTHLVHLDLSKTDVTDLTPLQHLTSLQHLNLASTPRLRDLTPLQHLTQLTQLFLAFTRIDDLTPLQGLSRLRRIDLRGIRHLDLTPLRQHPHLDILESVS